MLCPKHTTRTDKNKKYMILLETYYLPREDQSTRKFTNLTNPEPSQECLVKFGLLSFQIQIKQFCSAVRSFAKEVMLVSATYAT